MQIAFVKPSKWHLLGHLIAYLTNGPYYHVELIFRGDLAFSSRPISGTSFIYLEQDELYDLHHIHVSYDDELKVFQWCMSEAGCKYDRKGIFAFMLPLKASKTRWFCSEVCIRAMQEIEMFPEIDAYKTSPNEWAKMVKSLNTIGIEIPNKSR